MGGGGEGGSRKKGEVADLEEKRGGGVPTLGDR